MEIKELEHEFEDEFLQGERLRRVHLVLNNYEKHGDSRDTLINKCRNTNARYFCLGMEVSETGTPHCHIYLDFKNARGFNALKKRFPYAYIEIGKGVAYGNYLYIRKKGKHSEKSCTSVPGAFYEEFNRFLGVYNLRHSLCVYELYEAKLDETIVVNVMRHASTDRIHQHYMHAYKNSLTKGVLVVI